MRETGFRHRSVVVDVVYPVLPVNLGRVAGWAHPSFGIADCHYLMVG
jgi:hypothetical protein